MKYHHPLLIFACVLALSACGKDSSAPADQPGSAAAADESEAVGVMLDTEAQAKLGVMTAALDAAKYQDRIEGPGSVLDVQPIAQMMADLATAEASVTASTAALKRAEGLYKAGKAISEESLEAARRQAIANEANLALAKTKARVAFGPDAPWLDASRRPSILKKLTEGSAAIVKATFPSGLGEGSEANLTISKLGGAPSTPSWQANTVWTGPADPAVPGPTLLAYVEAAKGLTPGDHVTASLPTGQQSDGVIVPASAVVIAGGAAWCYAVENGDHFMREPVDLDHPAGDGYFQASSGSETLKAGATIVVQGAGLLLARETGGGEEED